MDINVRMQILKRSPLFNDFPEFTLKAISENTELLTYPKETVIFKEGDKSGHLYIIAMGSVTVLKQHQGKEIELDVLEIGDYCGELNFFNGMETQPITARAHEKTILFTIPKDVFLVLAQQNPSVAYNFMKTMTMRLKHLYQKVVELAARKPVASREATAELVNIPENALASGEFSLSEEEVHKMTNMLYNHKQQCPLCEKKFTTPRVLSRYIRIKKTDSDFCNHYENINPLYYEVTVCPKCSYAYLDDSSDPLYGAVQDAVKKLLANVSKKDYCTVRDINMARESFILALKCQSSYGSKKSVLARLYLRLAWLYRYQEDQKSEQEYLKLALENYETAFTRESFDTKTELQMLYIIGELYNQLGDPKGAIQWFNRLVLHQEQHTYPAIVNKAREQWQEIRTAMKERK